MDELAEHRRRTGRFKREPRARRQAGRSSSGSRRYPRRALSRARPNPGRRRRRGRGRGAAAAPPAEAARGRVVSALAWQAPFALTVAAPRTRLRDAGVYTLQMLAYVAHYEMPNDDPEALLARLRIDYPIEGGPRDRARRRRRPSACSARLGGGEGVVRRHDLWLSWVHWSWFFVPHTTRRVRPLAPAGAVPARRGADGGHVRPGLRRLLGACRPRRLVGGEERESRAGAADHGRRGRALLGKALAAALRFAGRESPCRHAIASLRHLRHGGARPVGRRPRARRGRLGVRGRARFRARLPGRALRRGPARRDSRCAEVVRPGAGRL